MGTRLRLFIIVGIIIALVGIVNMIKKEKLDLKYSLSWILASGAIFVMALVPSTIDYMAKLLNIASPINALFFVGMCFVLFILFSLTVAQSRNSQKIKNITQKLAIIEHEMKEKIKKEDKSNDRK